VLFADCEVFSSGFFDDNLDRFLQFSPVYACYLSIAPAELGTERRHTSEHGGDLQFRVSAGIHQTGANFVNASGTKRALRSFHGQW
jgi:hypothetical protein